MARKWNSPLRRSEISPFYLWLRRADPQEILELLCHRIDELTSRFVLGGADSRHPYGGSEAVYIELNMLRFMCYKITGVFPSSVTFLGASGQIPVPRMNPKRRRYSHYEVEVYPAGGMFPFERLSLRRSGIGALADDVNIIFRQWSEAGFIDVYGPRGARRYFRDGTYKVI